MCAIFIFFSVIFAAYCRFLYLFLSFALRLLSFMNGGSVGMLWKQIFMAAWLFENYVARSCARARGLLFSSFLFFSFGWSEWMCRLPILHRFNVYGVKRNTGVFRCHCFKIHYRSVAFNWQMFGNWHLMLFEWCEQRKKNKEKNAKRCWSHRTGPAHELRRFKWLLLREMSRWDCNSFWWKENINRNTILLLHPTIRVYY